MGSWIPTHDAMTLRHEWGTQTRANRWVQTKQIHRFAYSMNDFVVHGTPSRSGQDDTREFSGIQSAAFLGDPVLAYGPVFIG
jgi:hypothetical protein